MTLYLTASGSVNGIVECTRVYLQLEPELYNTYLIGSTIFKLSYIKSIQVLVRALTIAMKTEFTLAMFDGLFGRTRLQTRAEYVAAFFLTY